jgi:hypothetical protein
MRIELDPGRGIAMIATPSRLSLPFCLDHVRQSEGASHGRISRRRGRVVGVSRSRVLLWSLRSVLRTMGLSAALLLDLLPAVPMPALAAVLRVRGTVRVELLRLQPAVWMATRLCAADGPARLLAVHYAGSERFDSSDPVDRERRSETHAGSTLGGLPKSESIV